MMKILVVDEEGAVQQPLKERLVREGYGVVEASSGDAAAAMLEREVPDLVLLEVRPQIADSLKILQSIQERLPDVPVIVLAPSEEVDKAVEATALAAFDIVAKPIHLDELALTVRRALEASQLRRVVNIHVREQKALFGVDKLVGPSKAMEDVRSLIEKVAHSQTATVLARGESGTGKDLVAKAIHAESTRADKPFVNITCTALQDALLESELFGHEKGAFTDAKAMKKGLLELAQGGTVLLDEIGDMSAVLQGKLLRVLEEKTFRRVGGTQEIRVDVRIVAATHVNLERLIEEKKFREDLYYRLTTITIDIPPLRDRREDIPSLVAHFLGHFSRELKKGASGLSTQAMQKLKTYDWPGNVRELRNVIERAVLLGDGSKLDADDIVLGRPIPAGEQAKRSFKLPPTGLDLAELDRDLVVQALERSEGNQTKAGDLLGISRDQVHYRMQKYGLL